MADTRAAQIAEIVQLTISQIKAVAEIAKLAISQIPTKGVKKNLKRVADDEQMDTSHVKKNLKRAAYGEQINRSPKLPRKQ